MTRPGAQQEPSVCRVRGTGSARGQPSTLTGQSERRLPFSGALHPGRGCGWPENTTCKEAVRQNTLISLPGHGGAPTRVPVTLRGDRPGASHAPPAYKEASVPHVLVLNASYEPLGV